MEMLAKSTVLMTCPRAFNRVLCLAKLKGLTSEPMMRNTEYSAVSAESVLLSVVVVLVSMMLMLFTTVTGAGTIMVGTGVGVVVATDATSGEELETAAATALSVEKAAAEHRPVRYIMVVIMSAVAAALVKALLSAGVLLVVCNT